MTLAELKEMIEDLEIQHGEDVLDLEVYGEYDYGDHCHTRALAEFRSVILTVPEKSGYSRSGVALAREAEDNQAEGPGEDVVVALTNEYV